MKLYFFSWDYVIVIGIDSYFYEVRVNLIIIMANYWFIVFWLIKYLILFKEKNSLSGIYLFFLIFYTFFSDIKTKLTLINAIYLYIPFFSLSHSHLELLIKDTSWLKIPKHKVYTKKVIFKGKKQMCIETYFTVIKGEWVACACKHLRWTSGLTSQYSVIVSLKYLK